MIKLVLENRYPQNAAGAVRRGDVALDEDVLAELPPLGPGKRPARRRVPIDACPLVDGIEVAVRVHINARALIARHGGYDLAVPQIDKLRGAGVLAVLEPHAVRVDVPDDAGDDDALPSLLVGAFRASARASSLSRPFRS